MSAKYESMKKALRSYESAVEKLQNKRAEERREREAKDQIVEHYLQQMKADHEFEIQALHEQLGQAQTGKVAVVDPKAQQEQSEQMKVLRNENTELKRKVAEAGQQVQSLQR